jgi:hypothetical protein
VTRCLLAGLHVVAGEGCAALRPNPRGLPLIKLGSPADCGGCEGASFGTLKPANLTSAPDSAKVVACRRANTDAAMTNSGLTLDSGLRYAVRADVGPVALRARNTLAVKNESPVTLALSPLAGCDACTDWAKALLERGWRLPSVVIPSVSAHAPAG